MTHCCWGLCNSDSQYGPGSKRPRADMIGVRFTPFPKPKTQLEKCLRWIKLCGNIKISDPSDVTRNHYVCSKHFVGGAGPTAEHPDPLPAVGGEIETAHNVKKHRKRPAPKERGQTEVCKKSRVVSGVPESLRVPENSASVAAFDIEPTTFASKSVQTDICMMDFDQHTKNVVDGGCSRRKFISDDILKDDKSSKFYTGWLAILLRLAIFPDPRKPCNLAPLSNRKTSEVFGTRWPSRTY